MFTLGHIEQFNQNSESITTYLGRVDIFFDANKIEEDRKVPLLLSLIGGKVYSTLLDIVDPDKPSDKTLDILKRTLKEHYELKPTVIVERFYFYKRTQRSSESVAEYVTELKKMASSCEFCNHLDKALRDRFVCGLARGNAKTEKDLTFRKAVEIAENIELAD